MTKFYRIIFSLILLFIFSFCELAAKKEIDFKVTVVEILDVKPWSKPLVLIDEPLVPDIKTSPFANIKVKFIQMSQPDAKLEIKPIIDSAYTDENGKVTLNVKDIHEELRLIIAAQKDGYITTLKTLSQKDLNKKPNIILYMVKKRFELNKKN